MAMVQEFYISRYITADSGLLTPVEDHKKNTFQVSAYRRSFECLYQTELAQPTFNRGSDLQGCTSSFFWPQPTFRTGSQGILISGVPVLFLSPLIMTSGLEARDPSKRVVRRCQQLSSPVLPPLVGKQHCKHYSYISSGFLFRTGR